MNQQAFRILLLLSPLCLAVPNSSAETAPTAVMRQGESEQRGHENENEVEDHHQGEGTDASRPSPSPTASPTPSTPPGSSTSSTLPPRKINLRLSALDPNTAAKGRVERKVEIRRRAVKRDRLTVKVQIPVPSTVPAIADLNEGAALDVRASFSRGGTEYARCQLGVDRFSERRGNSVKIQYALDIEARVVHSTVQNRVRKGSCDTDLTTAGDENTVPDFRAGDQLTVSVAGGTPFLGTDTTP